MESTRIPQINLGRQRPHWLRYGRLVSRQYKKFVPEIGLRLN